VLNYLKLYLLAMVASTVLSAEFIYYDELQVGSGKAPASSANDIWLVANKLNLNQLSFDDGKESIRVGSVKPIVYIDNYALRGFLHNTFSSRSMMPVTPYGLGVAGVIMQKNHYLSGSFIDANANSKDPGYDTFLKDKEYFSHMEYGWIMPLDDDIRQSLHATVWHLDERERIGKPESWGIGVAGSWEIGEKWMPFLKASYTEDNPLVLNSMVSVGTGYKVFDRDQLGAGVSWGKPSNAPRDQYTSEIFYNFKVARNITIKPDVQYVINPHNNIENDELFSTSLNASIIF